MKIDDHIRDYFLFQKKIFTDEDILNIEHKCLFSFPQDYIDFVKTYGGVSFNNSCYNDFLEATSCNDGLVDVPEVTQARIIDGGEEQLISVSLDNLYMPLEIITIYLDFTKGSLVDNATTLFPSSLLPIGCCGGVDLFLLKSEQEGGRVFYWLRTYDEWGSNGNNKLWHVSNSFNEFIASLETE